jgi:hypothetical protein
MAKESFTVVTKAVVSTVVGGKPVELESGRPYTTTDPDEAEALRAIDGVREVSSSDKKGSD